VYHFRPTAGGNGHRCWGGYEWTVSRCGNWWHGEFDVIDLGRGTRGLFVGGEYVVVCDGAEEDISVSARLRL